MESGAQTCTCEGKRSAHCRLERTPQDRSREALTSSLLHPTENTLQFRYAVSQVVTDATSNSLPITALNAQLQRLCKQYYPAQAVSKTRPGEDPAVTEGVRHMCKLKRRAVGPVRRRVFAAWTRYRDFMKAGRAQRAVPQRAQALARGSDNASGECCRETM